jgi:hypothetical protein
MKLLDNIYEEKMLSHLPDPIDILRSDRICTPNWLKNFKPYRPFPIKKFLGSRVVYYPASGVDFHPVEVFGSAGAASCFVMADYIIPKNDFQSFIRNSWGLVKGYELSYFEELPIGLVLKSKWERHFFPSPDEQDFIRHFQAPERYAFVGILDSHTVSGLERLAFLFLGCEAIEVYDRLFCQRGSSTPYGVLAQNHAMGGDWTPMADPQGHLARLVDRFGRPRWLMAQQGAHVWRGYHPVSAPSHGGMHGLGRCLHTYKHSEKKIKKG